MAASRVVVTPAADRQLAQLPRAAREMVAAAMVALGAHPRPSGCVTLSGGGDLWRVRVRDYRLIYLIADDRLIVTIVQIGHRNDASR